MSMQAGSAVDTLRTAAEHMRRHHGPSHERHLFWTRLAAWLEYEATEAERPTIYGSGATDFILFGSYPQRIAEAYLDSLAIPPEATP